MVPSGTESPSVGIFVGSLEDAFQSSLIRGAFEECQLAGARLVILNGGAIGASPLRNNLYSLVDPSNFDALIFSGSISLFLNEERYLAFCRGFGNLPIVTLGSRVPGVPHVEAQNQDGMEELMDHLLDFHGYRRLAFIGGPSGQQESELRKCLFLEKIRARGLDVPAAWVVEGDFTRDSGFTAMEKLLAAGEPAFEGIVAANDLMAIGAYQALSLRGIEVPRDLFLTGFDDSEEGRFHTPPLTTVRQSPYYQAREAARMALQLHRGQPGPPVTAVPTSLVVRTSCGCPPGARFHADLRSSPPTAVAGELRFHALRDSFDQAVLTGVLPPFHRELEGLLEDSSAQDLDLVWQASIDEFRREMLTRDFTPEQLTKGESLLHAARSQVSEYVLRKDALTRFQTEVETGRRNACNEALITAFDLPSVLRTLGQFLPYFGFQGAWLALLEDPGAPGSDAVLHLDFDRNRDRPLGLGGKKFNAGDLFPGSLRSLGADHDLLVVEALYSDTESLGWLILSSNFDGLKFSGSLRAQVNGALKGIILREEKKQNEFHLLQSEKMAALGSLVAGVSHEINTPLGVSLSASSYLKTLTQGFRKKLSENQLRRSELDTFVDSIDESVDLLSFNLGRAIGLVSSFKQVAADQTSEIRRTFALKEYLEEVLVSLGPQWKTRPIRIVVEGPTGLSVDTYPGVIAQVVTNLLVNSLNHAFTGPMEGTIRIEVESREDLAVFRFGDDGMGIDPRHLPRIFDPFFTTKRGQGGTGLGLHIVYNLVTQALGGTITCQSLPNQGTTFEVAFPLVGPTRG